MLIRHRNVEDDEFQGGLAQIKQEDLEDEFNSKESGS
jgi:hypothetical protein